LSRGGSLGMIVSACCLFCACFVLAVPALLPAYVSHVEGIIPTKPTERGGFIHLHRSLIPMILTCS
jgi:hypothetical protein